MDLTKHLLSEQQAFIGYLNETIKERNLENKQLRDELESLRNEITVTKYTKGRPSVVDWNGERWIYDPQTTFKGGASGGKSKATQPH